jgi:hypothetical protein
METESTGNGPSDNPVLASAAESVGAPTAEPMTASTDATMVGTGKRSTGKTRATEGAERNLKPKMVLAILENALKRVRLEWNLPVQVQVLSSGRVALILPTGIRYCPKCQHLRASDQMRGEICQYHDSP